MAAVYGLVWTIENDMVFIYVGSARKLKKRKDQHYISMRRGRGVNAAVREMVKNHGLPDWCVLERIKANETGGPDDRVIEARERWWVEYYVKSLGRRHVLNTEYVPAQSVDLERLMERCLGGFFPD